VFTDPTYQDIFSHDGDRTIDELFHADTIIEFEQLPASELNLPAFLISILLERLRAHQTLQQRRGWLLVVEEAHNVLGRENEAGGSTSEAAGGRTLLRNVVRLLQEGRSLKLGVMVVDQSPALLARSVVKNTNTKVILRIEDGDDVRDIGTTLGLEESAAADLGLLGVGEAVIKTGGMVRPARSAPWPLTEAPRRASALQSQPPPDYRTLSRLWRSCLSGEGPAPDDEWLSRVMGAALGSVSLANFGLHRAALEMRLDTLGEVQTPADVLAVAREQHQRARAAAYALQLEDLERLLFAAAAELRRPAKEPSLAAVAKAVAILSHRTEPQTWNNALEDLCGSLHGRWRAASVEWRQHCASSPLGSTVEASARLRAVSFALLLRAQGAQPPPERRRARWMTQSLVEGEDKLSAQACDFLAAVGERAAELFTATLKEAG